MPFDDSPLALLYDRYAHIILNTVSRYTHSQEDARDLVLEVFTAALENQIWNTWSEKEQLAWLRRIARNKGHIYPSTPPFPAEQAVGEAIVAPQFPGRAA